MSTTPSPLKRSADEAFEGPLYLQHWFNTLEKADEHGKTHECKECQARVKWQGKKTGYKQFIQHVQQHTDWKVKMKRVIDAKAGKEGRLHGLGFTITKKISPKAKNLMGWIDQIVFGDKPFDISENEIELKYSTLEKVSTDTIMKYLEGLSLVVQEKLKTILPSKIWLKFDSWSYGDEHYTAIFACFTDEDTGKVHEYLLCCGPQDILPNDDSDSDHDDGDDDGEVDSDDEVGGDDDNEVQGTKTNNNTNRFYLFLSYII